MLTSLGRFLRKLRIDRNEILADMADKLSITASFLSAVENGKRSAATAWRNVLVKAYRLDTSEQAALDKAFVETVKEISIPAENERRSQVEVSFAFARRVADLSEDKLAEIRRILEE